MIMHLCHRGSFDTPHMSTGMYVSGFLYKSFEYQSINRYIYIYRERERDREQFMGVNKEFKSDHMTG